jgi:hypothetical protein
MTGDPGQIALELWARGELPWDEVRPLLEATPAAEAEQVDFAAPMLASLFPEQRAFVADRSIRKSGCCTRRAGKTWGDGIMFALKAQEVPQCNMLYLGLTRDSAKRALIRDVMEPQNDLFKLGLKWNRVDLTATWPNGSLLYILGLDTADRYKDRVLGGKYALAVLDEAQSFTIDVKDLIDNKIGPALRDLGGQLVLSGTPGNVVKSHYREIHHGLHPGWSVHRWSALDNPHMARQWKAAIAEQIAQGLEDDPGFRQNYLGEWVVELDALVYRFESRKNLYQELPKGLPARAWHRVLACDLGYNDDTALSVLAYNDFDPRLFVESSEKAPGLDITATAERLQALAAAHDPDSILVDGANKQAVEEMRNRHGLALIAADKKGKPDFIALMNSDFARGIIVLQEQRTAPLQDEYRGLIWDTRKAKQEEHPRFPNHCADSVLYGWRHCRQYLVEPLVHRPAVGTPEYGAALLKAQEDQIRDNLLRWKAEKQFERDITGLAGLEGVL